MQYIQHIQKTELVVKGSVVVIENEILFLLTNAI